MDNFEKYLEEKRKKEEEERREFFKKCSDKIRNGELIYRLLGFGLCERFKLKLEYNGHPPSVVWPLVYYYVDEVDEDWETWLWGDDAPLIKTISETKRIFPELVKIYDDIEDIVELANKLYGLELKLDYDCYDRSEYVYAYSFNFNTFKPLMVDEIKELKDEREVLLKYGYNTDELDEKLSGYGLTEEELGAI